MTIKELLSGTKHWLHHTYEPWMTSGMENLFSGRLGDITLGQFAFTFMLIWVVCWYIKLILNSKNRRS
jgi:hypothetical protein